MAASDYPQQEGTPAPSDRSQQEGTPAPSDRSQQEGAPAACSQQEGGRAPALADTDRLQRQIDFIMEADREKLVLRQNHLRGQERAEDDAEHAWHMALMAYLLREYANEPVDVAKTMLMCLNHDLVEVDAGDSYAYDPAAREGKRGRETAAADRIYALLPADQAQELRDLWEEFERDETPEAHFAHAMDCLQPMLLNDANGGVDWVRHGVHRSGPEARNARTRLGSTALADYAESILDRNEGLGNLLPG